jgi:VWFA-related protein
MRTWVALSIQAFFLLVVLSAVSVAQPPNPKQRVRTVTIPISIFTKKELKERQAEEYVQADQLMVQEDGNDQSILSIKSIEDSPMSIAILVQEDLASGFNLQIKDIQDFIRGLPAGTRVLVAYLRSGSPEIRQKFTEDHEKAAKSLRIVSGSSAFGPRSPYSGLSEIINRFDAMPNGRRAILLFSDGLDTTGGTSLASITQSRDLDEAILKAQRRSTAVYSFYYPTEATESTGSALGIGAQGALVKLSDETGGRAFMQGTFAPVSFTSYFRDISLALNRQFSLTYLSTHMKKGYHKVKVSSTNPEVKIVHPSGYYYR